MFKITVTIPTKFKAWHQWVDAPGEVSFLRQPHPHEFHVTAVAEVRHNDRAIEFYMARDELDRAIAQIQKRWDIKWSCEQIAQEIFEEIRLSPQFKDTWIDTISVSEDGIFTSTYHPYSVATEL